MSDKVVKSLNRLSSIKETTMEIEILTTGGSKSLGKISLNEDATVKTVKEKICQNLKKSLYPERQAIKSEAKGKSLKDEISLQSLDIQDGAKLYVSDLGPQVSYKNVFLAEYAGPLFVYLWVYQKPWILYGEQMSSSGTVTNIAAVCWSFHYIKRLLETLFVHRFSHGTMPIRNLFKNCTYYWLFALYIAYHVNHPLYTAPCSACVYVGVTGFILSELGNLSIHLLLKNLRPPGTKVRRIPMPDGNPFSLLLNYVSCPNYTYEFGAWISFTILTKCAPVGIFAAVGMYQMTVWALNKHRNYKKEFPEYPKERKAILPFII